MVYRVWIKLETYDEAANDSWDVELDHPDDLREFDNEDRAIAFIDDLYRLYGRPIVAAEARRTGMAWIDEAPPPPRQPDPPASLEHYL